MRALSDLFVNHSELGKVIELLRALAVRFLQIITDLLHDTLF
jgi:hypothetical protein